MVDEELEQTGDAAGPGVGQHLVVHLALVADGLAGGGKGQAGRLGVGLGEDLVDVVDELGEGGGFAVAGVGERDLEVGADVAGIAAEHDDAVGEQDGFFDIVGDDEDGLCGDGLLLPEFEEFRAEVFGRQHVQRAEGLVHEEDFGLDDQGAGEADALAHAARKFFGIRRLEAVETNGIEDLEREAAALGGLDATGFERGFDVFEDRQPGKEGKALEDDRDVDVCGGDGLAVPENLARRRGGEAGEHAHEGRFAGAGGAEQGDNLACGDREVGRGDDLDTVFTGLRVVFFDAFCAYDG